MKQMLSSPVALRPAAKAGAAAHVSDEQLRMILAVSRALAVPTDLDKLLCAIAEIATEMLGCERASIFLYDKKSQELWTKVALKAKTEIRVPCGKGIVGHSFTSNEVVHVPDPYADPRFNPEPDRRNGFRTRNILSAPMKGVDGKPLGVIQMINKIDAAFSESDLALIELLADQAGVAVQRHQLQMEAVESAGLRREMDLAHRVQQALIPKSAPPIAGLDAVGWTLPASTTGGDCYDFWQLSDGRLGVLVADASGHGLAPALIVTQVRTLVRAISEMEPDPHKVMVRVNARLAGDLEWGQFVTAFLAFLSPAGELHWTSAGHGPVLLRPQMGQPLLTLDPPVQPLGILDAWTDDAPPPVRIEPGGALILVSDGIFEATNPAGEQFGVERMTALLDACQSRPAADALACLRDAASLWHAKPDPLDDQTIVIVQRTNEKHQDVSVG